MMSLASGELCQSVLRLPMAPGGNFLLQPGLNRRLPIEGTASALCVVFEGAIATGFDDKIIHVAGHVRAAFFVRAK